MESLEKMKLTKQRKKESILKRNREIYQSKSPEEKILRSARRSATRKLRLANESIEAKKHRLAKRRDYKKRIQFTEPSIKSLEYAKKYYRKKLVNESVEERKERLTYAKKYYQKKITNESVEEREMRRSKDRARVKEYYRNQSVEAKKKGQTRRKERYRENLVKERKDRLKFAQEYYQKKNEGRIS
jgi:hypothetical protein